MLHSVPLKRGIQTLTLMQNPITKAGKMKTKTLEVYESWIQPWVHDVTPYLEEKCCKIFFLLQTTCTVSWALWCEHIVVKYFQSNLWSQARLRAADQFASPAKAKKKRNDRVGDSTADVWFIFSYLTCTPLVARVKRTDVLSKASPLSWTFYTPLAWGIKNKEKTQDIWKSNCFSPSVLWETSVPLVTLDQIYLELSVH